MARDLYTIKSVKYDTLNYNKCVSLSWITFLIEENYKI